MSYFEDFLNEDSDPDQGPKKEKENKTEESKILGEIEDLKASVRDLEKDIKKGNKLLIKLLESLGEFLDHYK
jgi:hypothetical protein